MPLWCSFFFFIPDQVDDFKLPFDEVGPKPSLQDLQEYVVEKKKRPVIKEVWKQHPVSTNYSLCFWSVRPLHLLRFSKDTRFAQPSKRCGTPNPRLESRLAWHCNGSRRCVHRFYNHPTQCICRTWTETTRRLPPSDRH